MSNYTTQVRFICESAAGLDASKGADNIEEIIQAAIPKVFNFEFPIFDESYRNVLETKILKHYYTREIGEETVGLWKFRLNTTLNEIMPFYNQLYRSELLEFNPLYDVDYTRSGNRDTNETGTTSETQARTSEDNMTGTITDQATNSNTNQMTGTVKDAGESTNRHTKTGTIVDDTDISATDKMTGTVADQGANSNTKTMTGTVKDAGTEDTTTSGSGTHTTQDSGTDTDTRNTANKNDHWDYFSDTPQGTIGSVPGGGAQALEGQTYLTNVRHITDDGTGSTDTLQKQYGKKTTVNDNTSGSANTETENTKTYNTTEADQGTNSNTKTYNTTDTKTEANDKTQTFNTVDADAGTNENTKTYNTTETDQGTNSNTKTYNTKNKTDETGNTEGEHALTNLQEYTERVSGKMGGGSFSKMLLEFRETFLNIDMMIINDLQPLFFGLWE